MPPFPTWQGSFLRPSSGPTGRFRKAVYAGGLTLTAFGVVAALLIALGGWGIADAQTAEETPEAAQQAVTWLVDQQTDSGAFPGFDGAPDPSMTADALIALAVARDAGISVDLVPALAYLEQEALVYAQSGPGSAAKLALAVASAGGNPHDIARVDPLSIVETMAARGVIGSSLYEHAVGLLALVAGGSPVPSIAIEVLSDSQQADGSWAFDGATEPGSGDTNTTAIVVQALVAAGMTEDERVVNALAYLESTRVESGGFPYQAGGPADANSTALVIQALLAGGLIPTDETVSAAVAALNQFQNESGGFRYLLDTPEDNLFSTVQVIPALLGQPLPLAGVNDSETDSAA